VSSVAARGLATRGAKPPRQRYVSACLQCEENQECIAISWCLYDKDKQAEEEEGSEGDSPS
jgi:hypothetical protein